LLDIAKYFIILSDSLHLKTAYSRMHIKRLWLHCE